MKAARSGKRTPWSRGKQNPANSQDTSSAVTPATSYSFRPSILQSLHHAIIEYPSVSRLRSMGRLSSIITTSSVRRAVGSY